MLIECLIDREGSSVVTVQKSTYRFEQNGDGHQVCEINSGSHLDYLLKLPDFRLYKEPDVIESSKLACDRCGIEFANAAGLSAHKRSKGYQDEPIANQDGNKDNA